MKYFLIIAMGIITVAQVGLNITTINKDCNKSLYLGKYILVELKDPYTDLKCKGK